MSYDQDWHVKHSQTSSLAADRMLGYLVETFAPKSYLDVGSGIGNWARAAQRLGVGDILAADGPWTDMDNLLIERSKFVVVDLEAAIDFHRKFDLAVSFEVAEHVSADAADVFVDTLTRHADLVAFGAAIPGQGGFRHINEQWPSYWIAKFAERGYQAADLLRPRFWHDGAIPYYYKQNGFVFINRARGDLLDTARVQRPSFDREIILDAVHPEKFKEVVDRRAPLKEVVAQLPAALRLAAKHRLGFAESHA